jgi:hypothetical protein
LVDHDKLRKFVGMLGSDHEGEQLNALRFIKRMAADEKLTITELLLSGTPQIIERIVYRDAPSQPYRRNYSGSWSEEQPRQKKHTSGFSSSDEGLESREILDALKQAGEEGRGILSQQDLDYARTLPYEYNHDYELSSRQVRYAKAIIVRFRRGTQEPVI